MYPSCCHAAMPLPPAIGPDDLAALEFIYPQSGAPPPPPPPPPPPTCTFTVSPTSTSYGPGGGSSAVTVTASASTCAWTASSNATWATLTGTAGGTGTGQVGYSVGPNSGLARSAQLTVAGATVTLNQSGDVDSDGDGLPDSYEIAFGLNPNSGTGVDGAGGDPDGDGQTNLQEFQAQPSTHPRGFQRRYLAEGAVNAFFSTEIDILNADAQAAKTLVRIQPEGQTERTIVISVPSLTRVTLSTQTLGALTTAPFSTLIEADRPLVVDRTMSWDSSGYGSHAETAVDAPSPTWYLAEGSTAGPFSLFYLLQNPNAATASATITFLRPAGNAPVVRSYTLPPNSRTTVPVDNAAPELASTDVSGVITATQPIIVERAMYLDRPGQPFAAGHESAGVTAPVDNWFLAEGATGSFFEMFVLIANPNPTASNVTVDYLLTNGSVHDQELYGRRQQPLHHLGRRGAVPEPLRQPRPRQRELFDARPVDQRRADHRRAGDVVAAAELVRGAQRARHHRDRHALGAGRRGSGRRGQPADVRAGGQHLGDRRTGAGDDLLRGRHQRPVDDQPAGQQPDQCIDCGHISVVDRAGASGSSSTASARRRPSSWSSARCIPMRAA